MIEEQSSECIASKIHLLQKSHFTNLPLLPLLLLTDLNPSTYNNFSASTNYTTSRTTYNKSSSSGSSSSSIEKSKSSPINRYQSNDWSKSNNICFLRKNADTKDIKQCLTRIRCCLVPTIRHLIDSLVSIRMHIDKAQHHLNNSLTPTQEFFANCKLIIIDSLTMPFLLYMATLPQFGISQLAVVISELQRLSALNHCAVLVTNHARSSFINTSNKQQYNRRLSLSPVSIGCLGVNWSLIPNHRVLFERSIQRKDDMTIKIKAKKVNKLHKTNRQSSSCIRQKYNSEIIYEFNL
ncbi:hypothetical protein MN116_007504 [Schistosoma mekongi]|uniref:RecA family profile 1 domain-containing protein n=1 Tax=Schistosoma mekongi TaxID=38744 RepID=A0AAE1Z949_SCHME|nr:hypothetical protein MN116_007504 [Schistosoma mekongi]